jgi:tryptophanyl-tRNA synthetase
VEGTVKDVEVKEKLAAALNRFLEPMRVRRKEYEGNTKLLDGILDEGSAKAGGVAKATLQEVLTAMGLQ